VLCNLTITGASNASVVGFCCKIAVSFVSPNAMSRIESIFMFFVNGMLSCELLSPLPFGSITISVIL